MYPKTNKCKPRGLTVTSRPRSHYKKETLKLVLSTSSCPTNTAQQTDTKPRCKLSCVFPCACIPSQSREHPFPFQTSTSIISATPPLTEYLQTYPYINRSKKSNYIFYQTATGRYDDPLRSQPRPPTSQGPRCNNVYGGN